jgi:hypothetical protein
MANKQMESLNTDPLADVTAEELEQRLEMQLLRVPEAACSWSCDSVCTNVHCVSICYDGVACDTYACGSYCS